MLDNILLSIQPEKNLYRARKGRGTQVLYPNRDPLVHGKYIKEQFENVLFENEKKLRNREAKALKTIDGVYLQFKSFPGFNLKYESLDSNRKDDIRLLNVKEEIIGDLKVTSATVFIPKGKEGKFLGKIDDYLDDEKYSNGKPKNADLINSIETVTSAFLDSFVTSKNKFIPVETKEWFEIWLFGDENSNFSDFENFVINNELECKKEYLQFSERKVYLLKANDFDLKHLICEIDNLAEIRNTSSVSSFFLKLPIKEQQEWGEELLSRMKVDRDSKVCISILDGGINSNHPLVKPFMVKNGEVAYNSQWGLADDVCHGTKMAGICAFDSLATCLTSTEQYHFSHLLENGKIMSNTKNNKELYGCITANVISNLIINNPSYSRIYCMAVTEKDSCDDGHPSSWSAEIDNMSFGLVDKIKKLFFVSAGNFQDINNMRTYPSINKVQQIQSPGQAWNCITVGGVTFMENNKSLAKIGQLSPFSSTSYLWKKWPIKPEVCFEGANAQIDGRQALTCEELSEITTEPEFIKYGLFGPFYATSLATAKASNFACRLQEKYLEYWPETIRAIMVNSSKWPEQLERQFLPDKPNKGNKKDLLRIAGYGVPSFEKAIKCQKNDVNMIIQSEIQPYKMDGNDIKLNEYCLFEVPWPVELLQQKYDKKASIGITLSYFVESNPGEVGWNDKYMYASTGLRFSINGGMKKEDFEKKVSHYISSDSDDENEIENSINIDWKYGKARDVGSVHSDIWETTAGQLADSRYIAIYPVTGWWKTKKRAEKFNSKIRFSLVVSLTIDDNTVDIYSYIMNQITNKVTLINEVK